MLFPASDQLQQWRLDSTPVTAVAVVSLISILLLVSRSRTRRPPAQNLPPGPRTLPLLGNLHQIIGSLPHRTLRALARQHGPVMLLRLGAVPTVVVSSPAAARQVMKTHDARCCSRPAMSGPRRLTYEFKDVAFAPYGERVRNMRRLLVLELLSVGRIKAAWAARVAQAGKLVANLARAGAGPSPVVALDEHVLGAVDGIVGTVVFGDVYGTGQFGPRFMSLVNDAMELLGSFSAEDFFPGAAGRFVDRLTGLVARRDRIFLRLDAFFEAAIDGRHLSSAGHGDEQLGDERRNPASDLLQALIGLFTNDRNATTAAPLTRDHVKAMLFDTFVGGINTSSVTMVWAMAEMIHHPSVLKRVQEEIRAVVGGKEMVSPDDVSKLRLLKMVLKETLRMHPPLTLLLPRETVGHVSIQGYDVPANTRIVVNAWAIGRDPDVWEDPEEFRPWRFMGSDVDFNGAHFELLPFGSGRRICPGMAMAVTNMEFLLANLLYCFDWELPKGATQEGMSMQEAGTLAFHKKTPLLLIPRRYQTRADTKHDQCVQHR